MVIEVKELRIVRERQKRLAPKRDLMQRIQVLVNVFNAVGRVFLWRDVDGATIGVVARRRT